MSLDLTRIEAALFLEIVCLHPTRLTLAELALRMTAEHGGPQSVSIEDAVQALKRSGLVRQTAETIEPTYAAVHAHTLLLR